MAIDRQRQGHGRAVMAALHPYVERGYELGALAASDAGAALYTALGWTRWTGRTAVLTPDGIRPTTDDDIFVRAVTARLDPGLPLVCDWRDGEVW